MTDVSMNQATITMNNSGRGPPDKDSVWAIHAIHMLTIEIQVANNRDGMRSGLTFLAYRTSKDDPDQVLSYDWLSGTPSGDT